MTSEIDPSNGGTTGENRSTASSGSDPRRPFWLGVAGLVLAAIALGLASIPSLALERPLLNPFAREKQDEPPVEPPREREGGITLKYKNLTVNLGGKVPRDEEIAKPEPQPKTTNDPLRWFTIAAIGCSLIGLVLSSLAQIRERHTVLTVVSMACCVAAITWQYVAVGIAVGVAAAVFLVVLAILAQAVN